MDANLTSILQVALQQGIWAALYIYLFFRMLKENAEREAKYQSMIDTLSGSILKGIDNCILRSSAATVAVCERPACGINGRIFIQKFSSGG